MGGGPDLRRGSKSPSGYGLGGGGANPLADLDRGVQIRGGPIRCDNRPYLYSQYWTGASLQWRLKRGNLFKCKTLTAKKLK